MILISDIQKQLLADGIKLHRATINLYRNKHLTEGKDYIYINKNMVSYTKSGAEKVFKRYEYKKEIAK
jgi:hypothetical protein